MANQNFLRWYLDWHSPIMHDLHESVPFLYIYSGQAPQNRCTIQSSTVNSLCLPTGYDPVDPLWHARCLTHAYVTRGRRATCRNGHQPQRTNALLRDYGQRRRDHDGAYHSSIQPRDSRRRRRRDARRHHQAPVVPPNPPYQHVLWSMRDNTNYAESGVLSSLQFVAAFPKVVLQTSTSRPSTP